MKEETIDEGREHRITKGSTLDIFPRAVYS